MILVIPYAFRLVIIIFVIIGLIIIKLVVMVLVISNTFSSVFKQLAQEREMNRVGIVTSFQYTFPYRLAPYLNIVIHRQALESLGLKLNLIAKPVYK